MGEFLTAQSFVVWLTSTAGLGVGVTFLVGLIKKLWPNLEGWAAMAITIGVTILLGVGGTLVLEFGVLEYVEPYWGVIVAIATIIGGFFTSQAIYHKAPVSSSRQ